MKCDKIVSIVIPVRNRAAEIVRCLDSIAIQDGVEHCRIIVVDNASTDNSRQAVVAWADAHPNVDFALIDEPMLGAAAARNRGLQEATTDYTLFFDSDDIMRHGHISRLLQGISQHSAADVFAWDIECCLFGGRLYKALFIAEDLLKNHLIFSSMGTLRYAARTRLFKAVGAWDNSARVWDDFELGVRIAITNPQVVKLADPDGKPLVLTLFTDNSITGETYSSKAGEWERTLNMIEKHLRRSNQQLLPILGFRYAALAGHYAREKSDGLVKPLMKKAVELGFPRWQAKVAYVITKHFGRGARIVFKLSPKK